MLNVPVIIVAPDDSAETIENVEEDSNLGKVVVIVDECQTKGLAVVAHQTICQWNTEKSNPDLKFMNKITVQGVS